LVVGLTQHYQAAPVAPADRVMLDYAVKLTRTPSEIGPGDIELLRSAGFDDRAVHDICAIAAYYAFVNRVADGLGVELEPRFPR
jgi:uncharacterized peroxidase-related enzyme